MKIKKGDLVKIISGKDRDKRGKVKFVLKSKNRIVVEGVNMIKKHQKATSQDKPKGILEYEASIDVSNVMFIDPKSDKPTRIGYQIDKTKKQRITKKSKTILN